MLTALFNIPTSTATDLSANVSDTIAGSGLWALGVIVIAIPLTFYVIKKVVGLFPKR